MPFYITGAGLITRLLFYKTDNRTEILALPACGPGHVPVGVGMRIVGVQSFYSFISTKVYEEKKLLAFNAITV